ncbi:MAG: hypothetical protein WCL11_10485, partial [Verrucomicrobiota bacterium]
MSLKCLKCLFGWFSALCLSALIAQAQETNEVEQLKRQLQQLQENFERVQREQHQQIETLTRKLDDLARQQTSEAEKRKLEQELAADLQKNQPSAAPAAPPPRLDTSAPWSPEQPLTIARAGSAYMNLSLDALTDFGWSSADNPSSFLELGDHDPNSRGFGLLNTEMVLDGAV